MNMLIAATGNINLASSWSSAWSSLSAPLGNFVNLMSIVGTLLVIGAIVMYMWERRRGGGNHSKLIWTFAVGAILAGPDIVLPTLLTLVDFVLNSGAGLLHGVSGG